MIHYFIINPVAGSVDSSEILEEKLKSIFANRNDEYITYITKGPGDCSEEIKRVCEQNEASLNPLEYNFYICGGDGSSFEGVNGVVGFKHARFTIIPVGSCNDFLKTFPEYDFLDIESLIDGVERKIDVLKVNDFYSINVVNIGFDARVNYDCCEMKTKYNDVKKAYNKAIIKNLFKPLGDKVTITVDGEEYFNDKALLMAFANGMYYGGGYKCAPKSSVDDGLIDLVLVKKVGIIKFATLVGKYKKGEHLDNPKFNKIVLYKQIKKATIEGENILCLCVDGETFHVKKIDIEIIPHAVRFVFPNHKIIKDVA